MSETPRNEEETGGTVQPRDPLRSPDEENEEGGLAAQNENVEEEETEIEDEEADKDEDEDKAQ